MEDENRQAHFIIGLALFVCLLLMFGAFFAAPPVQILVSDGSPVSSAAEEISESSSAVSTVSVASEASGPLNINTATADELETLPNIGPVLAQRIIDYRNQIGRFSFAEQLLDVEGIGEKTFAGIKDYITVE